MEALNWCTECAESIWQFGCRLGFSSSAVLSEGCSRAHRSLGQIQLPQTILMQGNLPQSLPLPPEALQQQRA